MINHVLSFKMHKAISLFIPIILYIISLFGWEDYKQSVNFLVTVKPGGLNGYIWNHVSQKTLDI